MENVCVLLSSYNGEKYLKEQLCSLRKQRDVVVDLLIRDDGSNDKTLSVIEEFKSNWNSGNFDYYSGENIGAENSFLDLMRKSPKAKFYAFCDQDDVWDDNKLISAIDMLKKEDESTPCLYYSNLRITDSDLNVVRLAHDKLHIQKNKYSALIEPVAAGCTMVFNEKAMNMMRNRIPEYCSCHDTWVYMICKMFGTVIYDGVPHIYYRQHENNVIGAALNKYSIKNCVKKLIKRIMDERDVRYKNVRMLNKYYSDCLKEEDRAKIDEILLYKTSIESRLKLLFDLSLHTTDWRHEMTYRLCIILGVL